MSKKLIISILAIAFLFGGALYVAKRYQTSNQVVTLDNKEVASQNTQPDDVPQADAYPQHIEAIPGTDEVWYNIPELGIRMRLNKEFASDLIYKFNGSDSVDLSSLSMAILDKACFPEDSYEMSGDFGLIVRRNGTVEEFVKKNKGWPLEHYVSLEKIGFLKKFNGFFIEYASRQAPCDGGLNEGVNRIRSRQMPIFLEAIKTIESL